MKRHVFIRIGLLAAALLSTLPAASAQTFRTRVIASGLNRPTGIAVQGNHTIYFTEVPTPGVNGANGGSNSVRELNLSSRRICTLHTGEPEPVNIIVGQDNELYWTCKSAGVILTQNDEGQTSVFLSGLQKPSGIGMDRCGNIYFTQVPTPGINGANGGSNNVMFAIGTTTAVLNMGEPEPVDIVVARNGDAYWTCRSAGVILERSAEDGQVRVLLNGLQKPTGIAVDHRGQNLYFTEVPTPGVGGMNGGQNKVWQYDLTTGERTLVDSGDPEPTDVAVSRNGTVYWTCTSAGVIVEARRRFGRH
jgi:sugar lactone lactonase YvrE